MDRLELFTNLVAMAGADGRFTKQEVEFLVSRAEHWGIPAEEAESVLVGLMEGELELTIPESHDERVELMQEMIRLMAVDGELSGEEKRFCAVAAGVMEFTSFEFQRILESLLSSRGR